MFRVLVVVTALLFTTVESYCQCTPIIGSNPDPATVCEDLTIQFSDNSTCPSLARRWSFGDGSPSTNVQNPSHTFTAGKIGDTTYTVILEKQDLSGVWSNTLKTVTVYKKPNASFTVSSTTACIIVDTLQFTNTSAMPAGNTLSWDFGDGSPLSSATNPKHTFNSAASSSYLVKLTVTNVRGCSRTATREIIVNEIPNPNFTMDANVGCDPLEVTFTNTTAEGAFPVTGWSWNFGNQGSSNLKNPGKFTFHGQSLYAVSLSATNTAGCTNTTTNNLVVKKTPDISFDLPTEVCVNDTALVRYTGNADPGATYTWDFKNAKSQTGTGQGPIKVTYASAGTKEISLRVTENGCISEGSTSIKVNPLPQVNLSANKEGICVGEEVLFTAAPSGLKNYTFYNSGTELQSSPSTRFQTTTLSTPNQIWVEAEDEKGCGSDASNIISVVVNQKPLITLSTLTSTICEG
ncbi:MAG: PKD domain-containing protein, partial [Luteibaculum sp.]